MRGISIVGVIVGVLMALGLGCASVSQEEVEQIAAKAVAEAAESVEKNVEQLIEEGNAEFNEAALDYKVSLKEEVKGILNDYEDKLNEALLEQKAVVERFMDDAETDIKNYSESTADSNFTELQRVVDETLSTIEINQQNFLNSICETDYWTTTAWNILRAMLQYLQGDEDVTLEDLPSYFSGVLIDDDYGTTLSGVCDVDDEWSWVLFEQPNAVPIDRRGY